jgi:hypothetical protein
VKGGHKEMYVGMMGHLMKKLYKKGVKKPDDEKDEDPAEEASESPEMEASEDSAEGDENSLVDKVAGNESQIHDNRDKLLGKKKKPKQKFSGTIVLAMGGKKGK